MGGHLRLHGSFYKCPGELLQIAVRLFGHLVLIALIFAAVLTSCYANPGPYRCTFRRLWTVQYISHWMLTLFFPRKVNRSRPMAARTLANTGSTVAILLL